MRLGVRTGHKTAHLIGDDGLGLCGRPGAGRWPGTWVAPPLPVPIANRCGDCDLCARNANRRPAVPTGAWRR